MSSVLNLPNGRRAVQFLRARWRAADDSIRQASRKRRPQSLAVALTRLIDIKNAGQQAPKKVLEWLTDLSDELADRLAKYEVIPPRRKAAAAELKQFLDDFIAMRKERVKGSTTIVYGHTRRCLVEYFGADRPLDEITPGDCDEWRLWLADKQKLADNTVRRRCGIAKQFFRHAVRKRLIRENLSTWRLEKCLVKENRDRDYFIKIDEAAAVLDSCPDTQWRLLFALSRFGGLRCPSEHLALTWNDVDLPGGKMVVHSPKTEHHEGKGSRVVPIFPELRPYLEAAWDEAPEGAIHVITRYRDATQNLRTTLTKIIKRAGLKPWPKLWQNLRSTRETELCESFPIHVVCDWIGNSQAVAMKHYLQVTDEHFQKAAKGDCKLPQKLLLSRPAKMTTNEHHEPDSRKRRNPRKIQCFSEVPTLRTGGR